MLANACPTTLVSQTGSDCPPSDTGGRGRHAVLTRGDGAVVLTVSFFDVEDVDVVALVAVVADAVVVVRVVVIVKLVVVQLAVDVVLEVVVLVTVVLLTDVVV